MVILTRWSYSGFHCTCHLSKTDRCSFLDTCTSNSTSKTSASPVSNQTSNEILSDSELSAFVKDENSICEIDDDCWGDFDDIDNVLAQVDIIANSLGIV